METIEFQMDAELAKSYQLANPEQQQKVQALVNSWLRRAMQIARLQTTMDQLSDEAEANGLTPEILRSILDE